MYFKKGYLCDPGCRDRKLKLSEGEMKDRGEGTVITAKLRLHDMDLGYLFFSPLVLPMEMKVI